MTVFPYFLQAWQAKQKEDENIDIQKPLFNVHGFTATQVRCFKVMDTL